MKLSLNNQEIEVPEADAKWFIEVKGAKEIKASTKSAPKAESEEKETQKTTKKDN